MEWPFVGRLRDSAEEAVRPVLEDGEAIVAIVADCHEGSVRSRSFSFVVTDRRLLQVNRKFLRATRAASVDPLAFEALTLVQWQPGGGLWNTMRVALADGSEIDLLIGKPDVEAGNALARALTSNKRPLES